MSDVTDVSCVDKRICPIMILLLGAIPPFAPRALRRTGTPPPVLRHVRARLGDGGVRGPLMRRPFRALDVQSKAGATHSPGGQRPTSLERPPRFFTTLCVIRHTGKWEQIFFSDARVCADGPGEARAKEGLDVPPAHLFVDRTYVRLTSSGGGSDYIPFATGGRRQWAAGCPGALAGSGCSSGALTPLP